MLNNRFLNNFTKLSFFAVSLFLAAGPAFGEGTATEAEIASVRAEVAQMRAVSLAIKAEANVSAATVLKTELAAAQYTALEEAGFLDTLNAIRSTIKSQDQLNKLADALANPENHFSATGLMDAVDSFTSVKTAINVPNLIETMRAARAKEDAAFKTVAAPDTASGVTPVAANQEPWMASDKMQEYINAFLDFKGTVPGFVTRQKQIRDLFDAAAKNANTKVDAGVSYEAAGMGYVLAGLSNYCDGVTAMRPGQGTCSNAIATTVQNLFVNVYLGIVRGGADFQRLVRATTPGTETYWQYYSFNPMDSAPFFRFTARLVYKALGMPEAKADLAAGADYIAQAIAQDLMGSPEQIAELLKKPLAEQERLAMDAIAANQAGIHCGTGQAEDAGKPSTGSYDQLLTNITVKGRSAAILN